MIQRIYKTTDCLKSQKQEQSIKDESFAKVLNDEIKKLQKMELPPTTANSSKS